MEVIFIRHGSAAPAGQGGDAARPLSEAGRREIETTARALLALAVRLERLYSSPLVRAVQTAEILSTIHGSGMVEEVGFLVPPGDFDGLAAFLDDCVAEKASTVGLVGHAPSLNELLGRLVAGRVEFGISLSKAGAACVELDGENLATELRWLMRSEQLAKLA